MDVYALARGGGCTPLDDYRGTGYSASGDDYLFPETYVEGPNNTLVPDIVPDDTDFITFTVTAGTGYVRWNGGTASDTRGHSYPVGTWTIAANAKTLRSATVYDSAGSFAFFATFWKVA